MLTSEHSIVDYKAGKAIADRLRQVTHRHYPNYAEKMLCIYRDGIGQRRRDLHRQVQALFADEPECPVRRIQAFCKLLDDKGVFYTDAGGKAAKLRLEIFSKAASYHPLVVEPDRLFEHDEKKVKSQLADKLGISWQDIEQSLYLDVMAFHRLQAFEGYPDGAALLSRYNVAQLQACLYKAETMIVIATDDLKSILRYAKLARLLHEIRRLGHSGYEIVFSGPASVLRNTRLYGVNFARFLPALLACRGWKLTAILQTPWDTHTRVELSEKDGFTSHLPAPEEFDSSLEESLATKFGPIRDGWQLIREGEILHDRQKTFVPDFTFRHKDDIQVHLEIIGFWTPEYLARKRETIRQFGRHNILIAVPEKSLREGTSAGDNVLVYKTTIKLKPLMEALERIRAKKPRNPLK